MPQSGRPRVPSRPRPSQPDADIKDVEDQNFVARLVPAAKADIADAAWYVVPLRASKEKRDFRIKLLQRMGNLTRQIGQTGQSLTKRTR